MKMKEFGPPGARVPGAPLYPPMIRLVRVLQKREFMTLICKYKKETYIFEKLFTPF